MSSDQLVAIVLLAGLTIYALLAGADFGGGVLDLLATGSRARKQRALIASAIGPVWEVNHIWLILVIVLFFTGFPRAFAAVMTTMHVPLSIMLVGIVLRGSAFTFRAYDLNKSAEDRWNHRFSIPSVLTPLLLGTVIGAIAMGRGAEQPRDFTRYYTLWITPFSLAVGAFTLVGFTYLASIYLTLETRDRELQDDFRLRALVAAILLGGLAWLVYVLARRDAPIIYDGLHRSHWGFPVRIITGVLAVTAIVALTRRRYGIARFAAVAQMILILLGCALAQSPYLVPPVWTVSNAASPPGVLRFLLISLAIGSLILVPSLVLLFVVFKRHALSSRAVEPPPIEH
jgi:cytochrome d ubiquinol oxidase subunit II